jgi:hypothetical protein
MRAICYHRRNVLLFESTKAPSNSASRPKTVTPPILDALYNKLTIALCIYLKDIVIFLYNKFKVELTCFSIYKVLEDIN